MHDHHLIISPVITTSSYNTTHEAAHKNSVAVECTIGGYTGKNAGYANTAMRVTKQCHALVYTLHTLLRIPGQGADV